MMSLRSLLYLSFTFTALASAQQLYHSKDLDVDSLAIDDFKHLLEELPAETLHTVLDNHLAGKFQDGVFEQEHSAMTAIHSSNPVLATQLVELAKHDAVKAELRKRQNGTDTTTTADTTTTTTADSGSTSTAAPTTPSTTADTSPPTTTTDSGTTLVVTPPVTGVVSTTDSQGNTQVSSTIIPASTSTENSAVSAPASTTNTGFLVPVTVSTTDAAGSSVVSTASGFVAASEASVSVAIPVTTTNAQGSVITTSSQVAGIVITSTNAQGQAVTTTSALAAATVNGQGSLITPAPSGRSSATRQGSGSDVTTTDQYGNMVVLSDVSYGEVITATDARGSTFITTYTPGGGRVSSLIVETTVLPNGQRSTITSLALIGGAGATSTAVGAEATAASSTGPAPGLQSGMANSKNGRGKEMYALVGGVLGAAYLL